MLGFKQAFRLWHRRRQHRERGKAALEQSGWRSAVQAQSERSATRSAISLPEPCVSARMNATPSE